MEAPATWSWEEFNKLPQQDFNPNIHCVTKWSEFDTHWRGVSLDTLLALVKVRPEAKYVVAYCYGGYTTNLPLADLLDGKAFSGRTLENQPLAPGHGGPARLVVPHLYLSGKALSGYRACASWLRMSPAFGSALATAYMAPLGKSSATTPATSSPRSSARKNVC